MRGTSITIVVASVYERLATPVSAITTSTFWSSEAILHVSVSPHSNPIPSLRNGSHCHSVVSFLAVPPIPFCSFLKYRSPSMFYVAQLTLLCLNYIFVSTPTTALDAAMSAQFTYLRSLLTNLYKCFALAHWRCAV
ncbi:hypothetical protein B0H13DRAFT_2341258 [Mycena leptocephala]|nr:hypothetical protein B0H13DRAFT_2341258 [Mycena leptocephala]